MVWTKVGTVTIHWIHAGAGAFLSHVMTGTGFVMCT